MGMTLKVFEVDNYITRYAIIDNMPWFLLSDITKNNILSYVVSTRFDTTNITNQTYTQSGREITSAFINMYGLISLCTVSQMLNADGTADYVSYIRDKLIPNVLTVIANSYKPSEEDNLILQVCHSKSSLEKANSISAYMSFVAKTTAGENTSKTAKPAKTEKPIAKTTSTPKKSYTTSYKLTAAQTALGATIHNQYQTASKIIIEGEVVEKANLKSIAEVNDIYDFKRGQLLWYFMDIGYFEYAGTTGKMPKILGDEGWLVICTIGKSVGRIMVTEKGMAYISQHVTAIRTCTSKPIIDKKKPEAVSCAAN